MQNKTTSKHAANVRSEVNRVLGPDVAYCYEYEVAGQRRGVAMIAPAGCGADVDTACLVLLAGLARSRDSGLHVSPTHRTLSVPDFVREMSDVESAKSNARKPKSHQPARRLKP